MKTLPWAQMDCFQTLHVHKLHQKLHRFQVSKQSQQPTRESWKNVHILIPTTLKQGKLKTIYIYVYAFFKCWYVNTFPHGLLGLMRTMATVLSSARASRESRSTSHPLSGRRSKYRTWRRQQAARESYCGYPGLGRRMLAPGRARTGKIISIACVPPTVRKTSSGDNWYGRSQER